MGSLDEYIGGLFQDHHVIEQTRFSDHPVIKASGFDIQSSANRLHVPSDVLLAEYLNVSVHNGGPLKSYTDGLRFELNEIVTSSPHYASAQAAMVSAIGNPTSVSAALLHPDVVALHVEVAQLSATMKFAIINGDLVAPQHFSDLGKVLPICGLAEPLVPCALPVRGRLPLS